MYRNWISLIWLTISFYICSINARFRSSKVCPYISSVVDGFACPRISETVIMSVVFCNASVAKVCLVAWRFPALDMVLAIAFIVLIIRFPGKRETCCQSLFIRLISMIRKRISLRQNRHMNDILSSKNSALMLGIEGLLYLMWMNNWALVLIVQRKSNPMNGESSLGGGSLNTRSLGLIIPDASVRTMKFLLLQR